MADAQYLAGFFDGEGHVSVVDATGRGHYRIGVEVVQVDPRPLALFRESFGGRIIRRHDGDPKHRPQHRWLAYSHEAAAVLRAMRPFLIVKADIADVAIELYDRIQIRVTTLDEASIQQERGVRQDIVDKAKSLAHRSFDDLDSLDVVRPRQYASARLVPRVKDYQKLTLARQMRSDSLGYSQIAAALGSTPSAVRSLLKYHEGEV